MEKTDPVLIQPTEIMGVGSVAKSLVLTLFTGD